MAELGHRPRQPDHASSFHFLTLTQVGQVGFWTPALPLCVALGPSCPGAGLSCWRGVYVLGRVWLEDEAYLDFLSLFVPFLLHLPVLPVF